MQASTDPRALAATVSGAILIGFAPIFVRLADVGYTAAGFWRVALALPLLALLWWPQRRPAAGAAPLPLKWLMLGGVFFAADLAVWHQSIRFTSIANSTLLANLSPIFVTAGSVWLFAEHVNRRFLAGLAVALAGSALLVASSFQVSLATVGGDLLGVVAAVFYAGYLLIVSRERRRTSAIAVMWWTTLASAVLLLPATLLAGETLWPQSARGWAVLVGLALLAQVLGQGLIAWGMAHLPASFSSVSLLVQPVAASALAWMILAEPFGPMQAVGGLIVLGGILLCRLAMTR